MKITSNEQMGQQSIKSLLSLTREHKREVVTQEEIQQEDNRLKRDEVLRGVFE